MMAIEASIEDCCSIPHSSEWYAREPFDPSVTFSDNNGAVLRYVITPLDEQYVVEPGSHIVAGSIPPEEREVRDHLTVAVMLRSRVTAFDFWWSQFFGKSEFYKASLEAFRQLNGLCTRSKEHRAAFCRLSNSRGLRPGLRRELTRIVAHCDAKR